MVAEPVVVSSRAAYMRDYRARNADARAREKAADAARGAALTRLAREHADHYGRLLDEERRERGLPPKGRYQPLPPAVTPAAQAVDGPVDDGAATVTERCEPAPPAWPPY